MRQPNGRRDRVPSEGMNPAQLCGFVGVLSVAALSAMYDLLISPQRYRQAIAGLGTSTEDLVKKAQARRKQTERDQRVRVPTFALVVAFELVGAWGTFLADPSDRVLRVETEMREMNRRAQGRGQDHALALKRIDALERQVEMLSGCCRPQRTRSHGK